MRSAANPSLARPSVDLAPEVAFLLRHGFDESDLADATATAARLSLSAERVLICEGRCPEERYYRLLAADLHLPFVDDFAIEETAAQRILARCELARLAGDGPSRYVMAPRGGQIGNLFQPRGRGVAGIRRLAITTPSRLAAGVLEGYAHGVSETASGDLDRHARRWSARHYPTIGQAGLLALTMAAVLGCALVDADLPWLLSGLLLGLCFMLQTGIRILATLRSPLTRSAPRIRLVGDEALPVYTILVPLYREAAMLKPLVSTLAALDYPRAKLDIKILLERGDEETLREARRLGLQPPFEVIVCPTGEPRTKPRALNVGLSLARGSLLVVYDAEDRPEPGQLRLAASAFAAAGPDLACLQAALAIDNAEDGWLCRLFALEYALLFDVLLPGMTGLGLPVPLGGTSNHFRVAALRDARGWDAWNVTEDADLGLRLARCGYKVDRLASTTWEEAPIRTGAWLRQRRRWIKGWMQTSMVHGSLSGQRIREVGPLGTLAILAHSCCVVLSSLCWPIFACGYVWGMARGTLLDPETPVQAALAILAPCVAIPGVAAFLWPWALGAALRRIPVRMADGLLLPLYFLLGSWASWRALFELVHAPYYWAKTEHGLSRRRRSALPVGDGAAPGTRHDQGSPRPTDAG